jgi:hypothetical protein
MMAIVFVFACLCYCVYHSAYIWRGGTSRDRWFVAIGLLAMLALLAFVVALALASSNEV